MLSGMRATEVIAAFAAAWNTAGDAERLDLLAVCCQPDAVFAAPQGQVRGTAGSSCWSHSTGRRRCQPSSARTAWPPR
jgi:hypothetical protein